MDQSRQGGLSPPCKVEVLAMVCTGHSIVFIMGGKKLKA